MLVSKYWPSGGPATRLGSSGDSPDARAAGFDAALHAAHPATIVANAGATRRSRPRVYVAVRDLIPPDTLGIAPPVDK